MIAGEITHVPDNYRFPKENYEDYGKTLETI